MSNLSELAEETPEKKIAGFTQSLNIFFLCFFVTFILLGTIFQFDYGMMDDSDLTHQTLNFIEKWKAGNYLSPILDGNPVPGRYFPGYFYYNMIRVSVLGIGITFWHFAHLMLYVVSGTVMCHIAKRITGSFWPGIAALGLVLATGEVKYSSNWTNFAFTFMFEAPLQFLWLLSVACLMKLERTKSVAVKILCGILATAAVCFATIFKENVFAIYTSSFISCLAMYLIYCFYKKRKISKALVSVIVINMAFVLIWGKNVFERLPKHDSYGGTGSFNKDFDSIWQSAVNYITILLNQSDLLVFIGLGLLITRTIEHRRNFTSSLFWSWSVLGVSFILFMSLLVWPYQEGRYFQPAYFGLLLFSVSEIFIALKSPSKIRKENLLLLSVVTLIVQLLIIALAAIPVDNEKLPYWFDIYRYGILGIVFVAALMKKTETKQILLSSQLIIIGLLVLLQYCNLTSFIKSEINLVVEPNQKICQLIAENAGPNATAYWMLPEGSDGIGWASAPNINLFKNRPDVKSLPSNYGFTQYGMPKKGDVIVDRSLIPDIMTDGNYPGLKKYVCHSGELFTGLKSTADIKNYLISGFLRFKLPDIEPTKPFWGNVQLSVYVVESENWRPPNPQVQNFFKKI